MALRVEVANVSGAEPAVFVDRGRSGFGLIEIPLHHLRAPNPDLAILVDSEVFAANRVDYAAPGVRQGQPD